VAPAMIVLSFQLVLDSVRAPLDFVRVSPASSWKGPEVVRGGGVDVDAFTGWRGAPLRLRFPVGLLGRFAGPRFVSVFASAAAQSSETAAKKAGSSLSSLTVRSPLTPAPSTRQFGGQNRLGLPSQGETGGRAPTRGLGPSAHLGRGLASETAACGRRTFETASPASLMS
jgi:hypothetical protein